MVERDLNLRKIDLNLLPVLDKLFEFRHVSAAAQALGMSQPAVSRALQRLRSLFNDPLLVKVGTRYELTEKAKAIEVGLICVQRDIRGLLNQEPFDPSHAAGTFTVGALDFEIMMLLPGLIKKVREQAPKLKIEVMHYHATVSVQEYLEKYADLLLYSTNNCGELIYKQRLFSDNYAVIMCKKHPLSQGKLDLDAYANAQHVIVSANGIDETSIDRQLARLDRSRTVISSIPHFSLAPDIVTNTDLLVTLPSRIVRRLAHHYSFSEASLPFEIRDFRVEQFWHHLHHQDDLHKWVRDSMKAVADEL